ncbi:MAG TPA: FAD-dependent oxidoreductase [Thermoleophilaceae bacterium]|nr:FAD-dependent oxidoreductase [Thermoleophilaceae bacterium]
MPTAVIVGAGVFGSSLARQLAIDGWEVTLVEQQSPGWAGSASGGESRLVRYSHGSEHWYTRSAWRARELWREIDPTLLAGCGLVWFAYGDQGWEADSEQTLRDEGIPVERLEPSDAAKLFPSLGIEDVAWVLYEPEACVVFASRAVQVLAEQARDAGATLVRARAEPAGDRVHLERESSNVCFADDLLEADRIVWACGPWLPKLFPGLVEVRPTLQEVVFFEAGDEWATAPGWVDYDRSLYGHGALRGDGFKAASDAEGDTADPDQLGDLGGGTEARIRQYLAQRFPALRDAPVRSRRPCPYELTADTHFVAAPLPEHPHVWLLGGGSGHGFKHGPALAERMATWLGGDEPPDPRFALGPRTVDRSLRTAGVRATRRAPEAAS